MEEKKAKIIFQEAGSGIIIQRYTYHRAKPELNLKAGTRLKKINERPIPAAFAAGILPMARPPQTGRAGSPRG